MTNRTSGSGETRGGGGGESRRIGHEMGEPAYDSQGSPSILQEAGIHGESRFAMVLKLGYLIILEYADNPALLWCQDWGTSSSWSIRRPPLCYGVEIGISHHSGVHGESRFAIVLNLEYLILEDTENPTMLWY
jgi:hypothetical protein